MEQWSTSSTFILEKKKKEGVVAICTYNPRSLPHCPTGSEPGGNPHEQFNHVGKYGGNSMEWPWPWNQTGRSLAGGEVVGRELREFLVLPALVAWYNCTRRAVVAPRCAQPTILHEAGGDGRTRWTWKSFPERWGVRMWKSFPQLGRLWQISFEPTQTIIMNRTQISSSNLSSVGCDPSTSTLEVGFRHGGVYQYFDVPAARYDGLLSAYSKGSYFDTFIKNGGYAYHRVERCHHAQAG